MRRRPLGTSGLSISEIGFGCGPTAGLMVSGEPHAQRSAVALALSLGVDFFDTAPVYGDGQSELHLGRALAELGADACIATKVAIEAREFEDISAAVIASVEASAARLRRPISLIQLHNRVGLRRAAKAAFGSGALLSVEDVLGPGGVVEAFDRLRDRGLVRAFGCSGFGGETACVRELIQSRRFDAITLAYSMLNPSAWTPLRDDLPIRDDSGLAHEAEAAGMGIILLRVLEAGLLAGDEPPPAWSATGAAAVEQRLMARKAPAIRRKMQEAGVPPAQGAIRFALSQHRASTVLVGVSTEAQVLEAVAASRAGPLPAELIQKFMED